MYGGIKLKINFLKSNEINEKEILKSIGKVVGITGVIMVAQGKIPSTVLASAADKLVDGGNSVGLEVWKAVKYGSMWILAGFAVKDILESLNDGDYRAIGKIMFKYGISFAAIASMIRYFMWIDQMTQK